MIEKHDLPLYLRDHARQTDAESTTPPRKLRHSREDHDRDLVMDALRKAGGNRAKAARILGISRSWLYEKMASMGITKEDPLTLSLSPREK